MKDIRTAASGKFAPKSGSKYGDNWRDNISESLPLKSSKSYVQNTSLQTHFEVLRRKAIIIAFVAFVLNLALTISSFVCAILKNSASTTAFAADLALDVVSSVIILWRYYGSHHSLYMHAREQVACIYLGLMFIISGAAVIGKACADLIIADVPTSASNEMMRYIAIAAIVIGLILTAAKLYLYKEIGSSSLLLDSINCFLSVVFAVVLLITEAVIKYDINYWYIDPCASIFLAVCMVIYGIKVIYDNVDWPSQKKASPQNNNQASLGHTIQISADQYHAIGA